jgi:hypothetical protein
VPDKMLNWLANSFIPKLLKVRESLQISPLF